MTKRVKRRNIISYALRPLVQHLAPASRLLAPSANNLITSLDLSQRTHSRFVLDLRSEEVREGIQRWRAQSSTNSSLSGSTVPLYVVSTGELATESADIRFGKRGALAEDSVHVLSSFETEYRELLQQTEVLLSINLPRAEDLGVILAVCEGIQTHAKAVPYNLMWYNCHFFSWMIVTAVARRTYNWETAALSKKAWDETIRTTLTHAFVRMPLAPSRLQLINVRQRMGSWFGWKLSKPYTRTYHNIEPETSRANFLKDPLISQCYECHGLIERILAKLLLRSQLGSTLKKELNRVGTHNHFLAKCVAATQRALATLYSNLLKVETQKARKHNFIMYDGGYLPPHPDYRTGPTPPLEIAIADQIGRESKYTYTFLMVSNGIEITENDSLRPSLDYSWLQTLRASTAAAEVLSENQNPGEKINDTSSWETAWETAWFSVPRDPVFYPEHRIFVRKQYTRILRFPSPGDEDLSPETSQAAQWDEIGYRAMQGWKSTWDECEQLYSKCAAKITTNVMDKILERLEDVAPEQLIYGNASKKITTPKKRQRDLPSLQGFIRSRMEEHFEMADKFSFSSFEELITTAEEVMCEIWVVSLDIIESNRYQPRYTTASHVTT
ncbi:hypothetical protein OPQ81_011582 [Rhizoctonia solani]|nr:hypothetical protein OPQ81_011582 [Rhizoctonia solani]